MPSGLTASAAGTVRRFFEFWTARLLADSMCAATEKGTSARPAGSSQRMFYITGCVTSRCQILLQNDYSVGNGGLRIGGKAASVIAPRKRSSAILSALSSFSSGGT